MESRLVSEYDLDRLKLKNAKASQDPKSALMPVIKLHADCCLWLATHIKPDNDTLCGLQFIDGGFPEITTFSLSELEMAAKSPLSLVVEKDETFTNQGKTIVDFAKALQPPSKFT